MRYVAFFKVPPERLEDFVKGWTLRAQAEKVKVVLPPHTLYESYQGVTGFVVFEVDGFRGMEAFLKRSIDAGAEVRLVPIEEDAKMSENLEKFHTAKLEAESLWETVRYDRVGDTGVTKTLEILPLVEWRSNDEGLKVETGARAPWRPSACTRQATGPASTPSATGPSTSPSTPLRRL
jgi:hypothetical protein